MITVFRNIYKGRQRKLGLCFSTELITMFVLLCRDLAYW